MNIGTITSVLKYMYENTIKNIQPRPTLMHQNTLARLIKIYQLYNQDTKSRVFFPLNGKSVSIARFSNFYLFVPKKRQISFDQIN